MEQARAAVFGIEAVRRYIEERGQGDSRLATAIWTLVEAMDPDPDRIHTLKRAHEKSVAPCG
ncbi:MAG: hypothetical protein WAO15_10640 [Mycobacterium sp.]